MKFSVIISTLVAIFVCQPCNSQNKVVISGRVTDFTGKAMSGASVFWQNDSFDDVCSAQCDSNGYYKAEVPKGCHYCVSAIDMRHYPKSDKLAVVSTDDMRLEFWAWNFIADRDTTLDIRYHRMEAYGMNVFAVQGAAPAYQIYVRPMSLTRTIEWSKTQMPDATLSPAPDKIEVRVFIDGREANVLMKQMIKEYFSENQTGQAFLITVAKPSKAPQQPYSTIRIVLKDLENGDQGEGLYHYEHKNWNLLRSSSRP